MPTQTIAVTALAVFKANVNEMWFPTDPQVQAALIGAATTIVAATAGFGGLILQMRSQSRQSLEAIAENERRKLKAELYSKAVDVTRALADAAITFDVKLRTLQFELAVVARAAAAGIGYSQPSSRYPDILAQLGKLSNLTVLFIFLVENSRIVDPRIIVFRTAMNSALHDLSEIVHQEFPLHVMPTLPTAGLDGKIFPYTAPSIGAADKVQELCNLASGFATDITSYAEDFLVELQNRLLGDLFETQVAHRVPIDPQSKVISLANAADLQKWFETETKWGKNFNRVTEEVTRAFKPPSDAAE